ncbi:MAG TPA: TonB-dependent receptor [Ideonella sp.]|uniref:TonB-dependent receptor plug domain-containing protein n=1 Tax=Ideonella sp. TaxID=1929293 RepID=UPI002E335AA2|nr:TonB-dependent receptor [Ideonella sp.]HEX5688010.1 TonB-dependent receptor [Ideonella sp.]
MQHLLSLRTTGPPTSLLLGMCLGAHAATPTEEQELSMAFGDKSFVSIATGSRVPVARAPSIATVITAEEILASGATDLDEVLETVPGLHVARSTLAFTPMYTVRGIRGSITNPQVLMLVNGMPLTRVYAGDRGINWGGQPVENIARIEVIRGPGSALYGADAYAGVINLITKTVADIGGTRLGGYGGSFNTAGGWLLRGSRWGAVDVAGYLSFSSTDGARPTVEADAQTGLDNIFAPFGVPPASLAPGPPNYARKILDGALDFSRDAWRFRASYKHVTGLGSGTGVAQALDPNGRSSSERVDLDLSWHDRVWNDAWDMTARANLSHYNEISHLFLFPAGTNLGKGTFEDGMIGAPAKWERHLRLEATAVYTGIAQHRIRLGTGFTVQDMYRNRETKNFNPDFSPIGTGSLDDEIDVTDTVPFTTPHKREVVHAYVQDEWTLTPDLSLTAGLRHDRYSDFGGTTHPRVALVWEAAYDVTAKLMYGSAFRAPSFTELYVINNPAAIGNPDLKPETLRTLEAAVSWQAAAHAHLGLNLYRFRQSNIIRTDTAITFQNQGQQDGHGLELEAQWEPSRSWRVAGGYGYQRTVDSDTGHDAGLAPRQHANLRTDWRPAADWQAQLQVNWVADRRREANDTRPKVPDYTTVDLNLRTEPGGGPWALALTVRNLFDADAREPSNHGVPYVSLPFDIPLPGRSVLLQFSWRL